MPIDQAAFTALGITNFSMPANADRLASWNWIGADNDRISTLLGNIEDVDNSQLRIGVVNGEEIFATHTAAAPSYIEIGPAAARTRYYVVVHIGAGAYGSICKVSESPALTAPFKVVKLQRVPYNPYAVVYKAVLRSATAAFGLEAAAALVADAAAAAAAAAAAVVPLNNVNISSAAYAAIAAPPGLKDVAGHAGAISYDFNRLLEIIKEAVINKILNTEFPDDYNTIYKIGKSSPAFGRTIRMFFLLEYIPSTLAQDIQAIGNPAALPVGDILPAGYSPQGVLVGDYLRPKLCRVAEIIDRVFTRLAGNHGDLHAKNVMGNKLIDFGFFRLTYEGALIECNTPFNNRSSPSRDCTILIWYLWLYHNGHSCTLNNRLRPMLTVPQPPGGFFTNFDAWHTRAADGNPAFSMTVSVAGAARVSAAVQAARAAGKPTYEVYDEYVAATLEDIPPINQLGPLYKFFNSFENAACTTAIVRAQFCDPVIPQVPVEIPEGPEEDMVGGRGRGRSRQLPNINRKRRITRRDVNKKKHKRRRTRRV